MDKNEIESFRREYEKFYIERFIYGSVEVEKLSNKAQLEAMRRMLKAYRYLMNRTDHLNINDIETVGEMVNDDTIKPGFKTADNIAGEKAKFEPFAKHQVIPALNDLFYNYYYMWDGFDTFEKEARFHIKLMRIHPLEDGNKRTARLITTTNLCKEGKAPIIITSEDTDFYYKLVNESNYDEMAEFFRHRSMVEDNTMCGFYKARNGIDMLEYVDAKELRKGLLSKK